MSTVLTNIMSSDIFLATKFVDKLKAKYIDIPEDTLLLSMYGYLSAIFSNLIQNTATMVAEYASEAIPTKAKFEKNVLSHALSLGLKNINATPASISVILAFPEDILKNCMKDEEGNPSNSVILDKDFVFSVGDRKLYPYLLDYDVEIRRNILPNGSTVYTAKYLIDGKNPLVDLHNPYLPSLGVINAEGQNMIALQTTLRQMNHSSIYYKLIVDNPLETKTREFSFEDQLAYFYVEVVEETDEGMVTHYLEPIYEGLYDYKSTKEYINYIYLDEKTIRLKFNRSSYQPRKNAEVTIHIYTTLGAECNIYLDDPFQIYREIISSRYNYSGLYCMIRSNSSSMYGEDRLNIEKLKELISKEMLARGSYATSTDLVTFFNLVQTENCKIDVYQRVYNQLENIYFAYLLIKYNGVMIPTNTIDLRLRREDFNYTSKDNFILNAGTAFFLPKGSEEAIVVTDLTDEKIANYEDNGFLYICPYQLVVNKNPFFVSFYNVNLRYERIVYFDYINDTSDLQFIAEHFKVFRNTFNNPNNEFHMQMQYMQNINSDYDLVVFDDYDEIIEVNIKAYAVIYVEDMDGNLQPHRYIEGTLDNFNSEAMIYTFDFKMTTENIMAGTSTHMQFETGLKLIGTDVEIATYLDRNVIMKFFTFIKVDQDYGRLYDTQHDNVFKSADVLFPSLDGWTLTNIYSSSSIGVDIFYDYSDLMTSYVRLDKSDTELSYFVAKVPVIKKTWYNTEEKSTFFLQMVDYRRRYIQEALNLIDNPFGVNFKLFNTYGASRNFNVNKKENLDKVNISLTFEIKFVTKEEIAILPQIETTIREYIEDVNLGTSELHMPNLITYLTNLYNSSIVYIKFVGMNKYDILWQSIYRNPAVPDHSFIESQNTPEFININILENDLPDITFNIIE